MSHLSGFYFIGRFHSKVLYRLGDFIEKLFIKNVSFIKNWKRLLIKNKKNTFNYASTLNQINYTLRFKKKVLIIPVAIESLFGVRTPPQAEGKFLYHFKPYLAQKVHDQLYFTFLFSSIIVTQLLSACLKKELHLLPVSEMGKYFIN